MPLHATAGSYVNLGKIDRNTTFFIPHDESDLRHRGRLDLACLGRLLRCRRWERESFLRTVDRSRGESSQRDWQRCWYVVLHIFILPSSFFYFLCLACNYHVRPSISCIGSPRPVPPLPFPSCIADCWGVGWLKKCDHGDLEAYVGYRHVHMDAHAHRSLLYLTSRGGVGAKHPPAIARGGSLLVSMLMRPFY